MSFTLLILVLERDLNPDLECDHAPTAPKALPCEWACCFSVKPRPGDAQLETTCRVGTAHKKSFILKGAKRNHPVSWQWFREGAHGNFADPDGVSSSGMFSVGVYGE